MSQSLPDQSGIGPALDAMVAIGLDSLRSQLPECDHCDGTGQIWESCGCYECEYDHHHSRYIECANCEGTGRA